MANSPLVSQVILARSCASCAHPQRREIDRKIKSGATLLDIERWLATTDLPIKEEALRAHRSKHVLGSGEVPSGPRPKADSFLAAVEQAAWDNITEGTVTVTPRDGIAARAEINRQADRASDRDLMLQMAQILGGGARQPVIEGEYREWDELLEADNGELTKLLSPGG